MPTPHEPSPEYAHSLGSIAPPAPREEQRRSPRAELSADVSLFSESHFFAGLTADVSEGGVFVETHQLRPVGTELDVVFTLPNDHEVKTRGVVRWIREPNEDTSPGIGVQFVSLGAVDLAEIRKFLKHRPPLLWDDEPL